MPIFSRRQFWLYKIHRCRFPGRSRVPGLFLHLLWLLRICADNAKITVEYNLVKIRSEILAEKKREFSKKQGKNKGGRPRRFFNLNIGTVIFGALFLYMILSIIIYAATDHITSCQVLAGTLSQNETYTALVLRSEEVVPAAAGGYVNYFVEDSAKVGKNSPICGISQNPDLSTETGQQDLGEIQGQASAFSKSFDSSSFYDVYDFKYKLNGMLLSQADPSSLSGTICQASRDGIVAYSIDGYESLKEEDLTLEDFQDKSYRRENLTTEGQIQAGAPLYRLIQGETWSIVIPVTEDEAVRLSSRQTMEVNILKDGQSLSGPLVLFTAGDQKYVKITFDSGLVRYCNDRFLDVELVTNTVTGLKLPLSAVVTKEFYTIPSEMAVEGGANGSTGFLKEVTGEDGKVTSSFVEASIYAEIPEENGDGSLYYVEMGSLAEGDVLVQPDSNARYTVGQTGSLEGVYCVNRGYAVFRRIIVLEQDEEYCIAATGTDYGLVQFDYIVENGNSVNEEDILY